MEPSTAGADGRADAPPTTPDRPTSSSSVGDTPESMEKENRRHMRQIKVVQTGRWNDEKLLVPPLNFGMVTSGIYRSGYPNSKNFPFLKKLGIRTIIYVCPEEYRATNRTFCEENNISIHQFSTDGNLEPFVQIDRQMMQRALDCITDETQHPVLIHCQKGNHRTGVVVGCLRRSMHWSLTTTYAEYRRYTGPNVRVLDMQYIEQFDPAAPGKGHAPVASP